MTRPRSLAALAACCLAVALLPAAATARPLGPTAHASATTITMSGSTSVHPLAVALAKGYVKKFPGRVKFKIRQGGSDTGINDVAHGRVSIGNSSRDYQDGDPGGLQFNKIARDGVCIVTNPDNKFADVSQQQVQDIFSGRIRRWDDVQGATTSGPINLVVRTQASGTQDAFQNIFMGQDLRVAPSASQKATNGLVQQAVRSDEQAIGYVDFQFTGGTNVATYKGVACTLRNAKSGQYPGLRNLWFVTRGAPKGALAKFIRWAQRDPTAQHKIVAKSWVPIH